MVEATVKPEGRQLFEMRCVCNNVFQEPLPQHPPSPLPVPAGAHSELRLAHEDTSLWSRPQNT